MVLDLKVWNSNQDRRLISMVEESPLISRPVNWSSVAVYFVHKTPAECKRRYEELKKPKKKTGNSTCDVC
ncbi:unnamed protein product [Ambrosiozyma monospora]|uniref:Unnamed protein product n=1 Tax=Ambrosiozyma monospora TaxID=43982 RepID=A0A9W7DHZ9_AMBMO|nr:unnamed protein product [Ambrosiozyma monospora]